MFYDFLLNLAELITEPRDKEAISVISHLYKCLRGQGPEYLSEFFNVLNVNYNLRGASTRLMLPSFNLEYMHKSWSYLTTKLWNGLPRLELGSVQTWPILSARCFRLWQGFNFGSGWLG